MRVCPKPGCPTLIPLGDRYCPTHTREYEARRGTPAQRGYDAAHKRERARHQRRMDQGVVYTCPTCGSPVDPRNWDLGHSDDRARWIGPQCARCNRADGGRRGAASRG